MAIDVKRVKVENGLLTWRNAVTGRSVTVALGGLDWRW